MSARILLSKEVLTQSPPQDIPNSFVRGGPVPAWRPHTRFVAVDPGRKNVVSWVVARGETLGDLPGLQAMLQRQGARQQGPFPVEPPLRPEGVQDPDHPPLRHFQTGGRSASQYYEQTGHNRRKRWMDEWIRQQPELQVGGHTQHPASCMPHMPACLSISSKKRV